MANQIEELIDVVVQWAEKRSARAVALVGSYARGDARPESDVDLTILVRDSELFRGAWLDEIDWASVGVRPLAYRDVQYGVVWSRHVQFDQGPEVEFGFAPLSWADITPIDDGTRSVVMNGCRILFDPDHILAALWAALNKGVAVNP